MSDKEFDHLFKIVIVGDQSVGKSSLLLRFADDKFSDFYLTTMGVDFKLKTVKINDSNVKLQLWDTAGSERFASLTSAYYRGSHGIVFVYSVTDEASFKNVSYWLKEVNRNVDKKNIKLLVGNKIDLHDQRVIKMEEARTFADSQNLQYIETSAKTSENVEEAFLTLTDDIVALYPSFKTQNDIINLSKTKRVSDSYCSYCL